MSQIENPIKDCINCPQSDDFIIAFGWSRSDNFLTQSENSLFNTQNKSINEISNEDINDLNDFFDDFPLNEDTSDQSPEEGPPEASEIELPFHQMEVPVIIEVMDTLEVVAPKKRGRGRPRIEDKDERERRKKARQREASQRYRNKRLKQNDYDSDLSSLETQKQEMTLQLALIESTIRSLVPCIQHLYPSLDSNTKQDVNQSFEVISENIKIDLQ